MQIRALLVMALLASASSSRAEDFYLLLERSSFPAGSREHVYVRGNKAIRIRQSGFNDEVQSAKRLVAEWRTAHLSSEDLELLRENLVKVGVNSWKKTYPDPSETMLCDGESFAFALQARNTNVLSSGSCSFPDRFREVERIVDGIFK